MPSRVDTINEVFRESRATIAERETRYGQASSDGLGLALSALFPEGLTLSSPEDFARFYDFSLVVGKLNRYAFSFSEGGHPDSIHDAGNYAKLLEVRDRTLSLVPLGSPESFKQEGKSP